MIINNSCYMIAEKIGAVTRDCATIAAVLVKSPLTLNSVKLARRGTRFAKFLQKRPWRDYVIAGIAVLRATLRLATFHILRSRGFPS